MNRIQEHIINYNENKEDKNRAAAQVEIKLLAQILGVSQKLAKALADYTNCGGFVLVRYKGKKYTEDYQVERLPNNFLDFSDKYRALELIFNRIKREGK